MDGIKQGMNMPDPSDFFSMFFNNIIQKEKRKFHNK